MTKTKHFIFLYFLCVQILMIFITIESFKDKNQIGAIEESKTKIGIVGWGGWKVMGRTRNGDGGEKEGGKGEEVQEGGKKDGGEIDEESEKDNGNEKSRGGAGSWGWGGNVTNGYGQSGGRAGTWGWGGIFGTKN
ncbi:hypothetical protein KIW84_013963 [Lathyrus oleraceus]|uniref:Nodule-specific Glycine Rich Peptide n=1 Tax=Pisum sativum TaxID=3888 RepID=A0A9D5BM23_PEA|nr:hypothetical protein KIW84_013963 [Pisum sativum]